MSLFISVYWNSFSCSKGFLGWGIFLVHKPALMPPHTLHELELALYPLLSQSPSLGESGSSLLLRFYLAGMCLSMCPQEVQRGSLLCGLALVQIYSHGVLVGVLGGSSLWVNTFGKCETVAQNSQLRLLKDPGSGSSGIFKGLCSTKLPGFICWGCGGGGFLFLAFYFNFLLSYPDKL